MTSAITGNLLIILLQKMTPEQLKQPIVLNVENAEGDIVTMPLESVETMFAEPMLCGEYHTSDEKEDESFVPVICLSSQE